MPSNQAPLSRSALTGWLQKRKSESATSRFLRSANRRFFTLDFQAQIFYYSHTESKKNISMPVRLKDILSVEALATTRVEPQMEDSVESQQLSDSTALRIPGFHGLSKKAAEHGFVVKAPGKSLEIVCSCRAEADMWIAALSEGIVQARTGGRGGRGGSSSEAPRSELSTTPGSASPRSSSDAWISPPETPRSAGGARPGTPRSAGDAPPSFPSIALGQSSLQPAPLDELAPGVSLRVAADVAGVLAFDLQGAAVPERGLHRGYAVNAA